MKHTTITSTESGYGLLGQAIALSVFSMMTLSLFAIMGTYTSLTKNLETKRSILEIERTVMAYADANGHYPCPANISLSSEDVNFGIATACGSAPGSFSSGMIPIKTLALPHDMALDAYGNRLRYIVSGPHTANKLANDVSAIQLKDTNLTIAKPDFIILSHGKNGNGAISKFGISAPCSIGQDQENCDGDAVFTQTIETSSRLTNYFDDVVAYRKKWYGPDTECVVIPPRIVSGGMPTAGLGNQLFNIVYAHGQCPSGWDQVHEFSSVYAGPSTNQQRKITIQTGATCNPTFTCYVKNTIAKACTLGWNPRYCRVTAGGAGTATEAGLNECRNDRPLTIYCETNFSEESFEVQSSHGTGLTAGGETPLFRVCCR